MRSGWLAEWILSLATAPDRASSTVGDLMEDVSTRGWLWFWLSIVRTAFSISWHSFAVSPLSMVLFAVVAWFGYMIAGIILWLVAQILITLGWGLAYFFTHHTGLELLTDLLKVRLEWMPVPPQIAHWIEGFVVWVAAPFQIGRIIARCCPGREIAAWLTMSLLWPMLSIFVPFATMSIRISLPMTAIILGSVLMGILRERRALLVD
jgi:hypothetical protein